MERYKRLNIAFVTGTASLFGVVGYMWYESCMVSVCSAAFLKVTLQPTLTILAWTLIVSATLLFFEPQLFKAWIYRVLLWLAPLCLYLIVTASPETLDADWMNRAVASHLVGLFAFVSTGSFLLDKKGIFKEYMQRRKLDLLFDEVKKIIPWLIVIFVSFYLYIFTEIYCGGPNYCYYNRDVELNLILISITVVPTISYLLLFNGIVLLRWVRHIAWWFITFVLIGSASESGGGFLPMGGIVTGFLMIVLFFLTLIYAPVMNRYTKNHYGTDGAGVWQFRIASSILLLSITVLLIAFMYL